MFPVLLSLLGNYKVLGISARNQRQRPIYRFSIISQMCCQTSDHVGNWHLTLLGRLGITLEHVSQMTHTSAKGLGSLSPRQSLVLLPKDLNCLVFPACHVPVSSRWCPEKVFSPKTKLANEVRLVSMGMESIVWTLTVSHTTGLSLPRVRMLTSCGVPTVRLCDTQAEADRVQAETGGPSARRARGRLPELENRGRNFKALWAHTAVQLCGDRRGLFISVCNKSYLKPLGSDWQEKQSHVKPITLKNLLWP